MKRCIVRTTLSIVAVVIAESVPSFDLVMSVIGGTLTSQLIFMLPPLIYVKLLSLQTKYEESLLENSFTNVVLNTRATMNGVSKYVEDAPKENSQVRQEICQRRTTASKLVRKAEKGICLLIVLVSLVLTVLATYFNLTNAVETYSNTTTPCIYNLTMSLLYF